MFKSQVLEAGDLAFKIPAPSPTNCVSGDKLCNSSKPAAISSTGNWGCLSPPTMVAVEINWVLHLKHLAQGLTHDDQSM